MRLLSLACLGFVLAALSFAAPPAVAGGYAVTSCFGYENGSWSEWEPAPLFTTAYVACPGGVTDVRRPQIGEGLMVRNVVGPGHAPRGTAAALRFDAPAGTTITGFDFDARLSSNHGWVAGVFDGTHDRWLWCEPPCLRSFARWTHEELRGLATRRVEALVGCTAARRRARRHGGERPSVAARPAGRGVRRGGQQRHPARAGRARRPCRARQRARLRLHAAGAVLGRRRERVVRHAHVGRRPAWAAAVGGGRRDQLGVGRSRRAGGQHRALGAVAEARRRRWLEPAPDAVARAAAAGRPGGAARARAGAHVSGWWGV